MSALLVTLILVIAPVLAARHVSVPLPRELVAEAPPAGARALPGSRGAPTIHYPPLYEVVSRLKALAAAAPGLVEVWNAQERYGTPSPGTCRKSAAAGDTEPCRHWFVTISDTNSATADPWVTQSPDAYERPHVFFSGNLHGDEYVGPVTLLTLAELLVRGATPGASYNPWLARLVETRKTVILVVSNPQGYDASPGPHREERIGTTSADPNRDFPFHQEPNQCMLTSVARAINSAWREHIFQLAVTFHGGMSAISYEWGAPNHVASDSESPDDAGQAALGQTLAAVAGSFNEEGPYPVDRINNIVYPVDGGMEDWAYGGSWDTESVRACTPSTYGANFPAAEMHYNSAQLRAINVLVETSTPKKPAESTLGSGSDADILTVQGMGDGHVPRNLRLCLAVMDMVAPYAEVTVVHTRALASPPPPAPSPSPRSVAYRGPMACIAPTTSTSSRALDATAPAASSSPTLESVCGGAFRSQYTSWVDVPLPTAAGVETWSSAWVGWDVGGGMAAETTAALVGTWDPRVPPTEFWLLQPVAPPTDLAQPWVIPSDPSVLTITSATLTSLRDYGLTPSEATAFAQYLFYWQRFADGDIAVADMPAAFVLTTTHAQTGGTRWAFANAAPPLLGGSRALNAPVGAPDLANAPFETRFAACVRIANGAPNLSPSNKVRHKAVTIAEACDTSDAPVSEEAVRVLLEEGAAVPVASTGFAAEEEEDVASRSAQAVTASLHPTLRSLLVVPYAVVDAHAWVQQDTPEPDLPPQSHWVNARTNPAWRQLNNGFRVRGRHLTTSLALHLAFATGGSPPSTAPPPSPSPAVAAPSESTSADDDVAPSLGDAPSVSSVPPPPSVSSSSTPTPTPTLTRSPKRSPVKTPSRSPTRTRTPSTTPTATVAAEPSASEPAPEPEATDPPEGADDDTEPAGEEEEEPAEPSDEPPEPPSESNAPPALPAASVVPAPSSSRKNATRTLTASPTPSPSHTPTVSRYPLDDDYRASERTWPSSAYTQRPLPSSYYPPPAPPPQTEQRTTVTHAWSFSIYTLTPASIIIMLVVIAALGVSAVSVIRAIAQRRLRLTSSAYDTVSRSGEDDGNGGGGIGADEVAVRITGEGEGESLVRGGSGGSSITSKGAAALGVDGRGARAPPGGARRQPPPASKKKPTPARGSAAGPASDDALEFSSDEEALFDGDISSATGASARAAALSRAAKTRSLAAARQQQQQQQGASASAPAGANAVDGGSKGAGEEGWAWGSAGGLGEGDDEFGLDSDGEGGKMLPPASSSNAVAAGSAASAPPSKASSLGSKLVLGAKRTAPPAGAGAGGATGSG